jgi:hypothetical protein
MDTEKSGFFDYAAWAVLWAIPVAAAVYAIHLNAVLANRVGMVIAVQQGQQHQIDTLKRQ